MDDQNPFISQYGSMDSQVTPAPSKAGSSSEGGNPFEEAYGAINEKQQKDQRYAERV